MSWPRDLTEPFLRVRAMLFEAGLPKSFWVEEAVTTTYLTKRCFSTALDLKTIEEVWSNHPANYRNLKAFGCIANAHVRQGKLDPRAVKCFCLGYLDGFWVTSSSGATKMQKSEHSQLKVETSRTMASSRGFPTLQEVEPTAKAESESLTNYKLIRDRERRQIKPPQRFGFAELTSFALNVAEDIEEHEPLAYIEAVRSSHGKEWMQAMVEENQSLESNQTWELIDRTKNNRVIECK
ncbi:hypothetical protein CR513_10085, partial [Mucuna pruriens]